MTIMTESDSQCLDIPADVWRQAGGIGWDDSGGVLLKLGLIVVRVVHVKNAVPVRVSTGFTFINYSIIVIVDIFIVRDSIMVAVRGSYAVQSSKKEENDREYLHDASHLHN